MTSQEANQIAEIMDTEGIDYTFMNYSDFPKIVDEEFHKLRKEYVEATLKLENYIEKHMSEKSWKLEYFQCKYS